MTGAIPNIPLRNWRAQHYLSRAEMADRINASRAGVATGWPATRNASAAGKAAKSAGHHRPTGAR